MFNNIQDVDIVPFRNIIDCFLTDPSNESGNLYSNKFGFCYEDLDTVHTLYTMGANERDLWIQGFKYLIESTKIR